MFAKSNTEQKREVDFTEEREKDVKNLYGAKKRNVLVWKSWLGLFDLYCVFTAWQPWLEDNVSIFKLRRKAKPAVVSSAGFFSFSSHFLCQV